MSENIVKPHGWDQNNYLWECIDLNNVVKPYSCKLLPKQLRMMGTVSTCFKT